MIPTRKPPRSPVATALALMLAGCGGSDDNSDTSVSPPPPPVVEVMPIMAIDGFSVVQPQTSTHIDLTPYIRGGKGDVTAVVYSGEDTENCAAPTINGVGFDVTAQSGVLCDYDFTVKNTQTSASALMTVLATKAVTPVLPPMSLPLVLDTTPTATNINLTGNEWLGSDYPAGYILKSVSVQGGDDNLGAVAPVTGGTTITYTPPTLSGWNRLVYTLKNASKTDEDIIGSVYITVSESINEPPTISNPRYDYNAENSNATVLTGATIDINLSRFITEDEGQDWQVIEAQSYTGTVDYKDPDSVTNKVLTFTAGTIGDHIISYVVADHFGGYSVGMVKVTVSTKDNPQSWSSIAIEGGSIYTAPQRYSEAFNTGWQVNARWDSHVDNTIAEYSVDGAKQYCNTVGAIPTLVDMKALKDIGVREELSLWPAVQSYLALNDAGTGYVGYNLRTGVAIANPSGMYYVTCIENPNLTLRMITNKVVADHQARPIATVIKPAGMDIELIKVPTGLSNDITEAEANLQLVNRNGKITVITQSTKAGVYRFKISSADKKDEIFSPTINYISNVNTARINLRVDANNAQSNNVAENKITATVLDGYDNPVENQRIKISIKESGTVPNSVTIAPFHDKHITNAKGEVNLSFIDDEWLNDEDVVVSGTYRFFDGSNMQDDVSIAILTFIKGSYPNYCHQFPGVVGLNCLPYLESKDGKMYTGLTSTEWLLNNYPALETARPIQGNNPPNNAGSYVQWTHIQARDYCATLGEAAQYGRTDWQVPNIDELVDLSNYYPFLSRVTGWYTASDFRSSTPRKDNSHYTYNYNSRTTRYDAVTYPRPTFCVSRMQGDVP